LVPNQRGFRHFLAPGQVAGSRAKFLAISNVEKDSYKPMKIAAREQASRDWKRIKNKAKDDADDWSDM
jgi:hypothetical protein